MEKSEYHRYLASREWAVLKRQVQERCRGKCERCHDGPYHETHHLTYERIGRELPEDLQGVCEACHLFLSGKSDIDPTVRRPPDSHSATLNKIIATGKKLTSQIAQAEAAGDNRQVDRLLRRKQSLLKVQAQYVYFTGSSSASIRG